MSPRRFLVEFLVLAVASVGAIIGYSAGCGQEPATQIVLAFVGMGLGGAFTDICLRGGN